MPVVGGTPAHLGRNDGRGRPGLGCELVDAGDPGVTLYTTQVGRTDGRTDGLAAFHSDSTTNAPPPAGRSGMVEEIGTRTWNGERLRKEDGGGGTSGEEVQSIGG